MADTNFDIVMREIQSLGVGTPEYHEALWMLFSVLAHRHAVIADSIRTNQRRRDRAAATRQKALDDFKRSELIGGDGAL